MTTDIFAGATEAEVRTEKARRAVKMFRALQPGLSGYARALTKRRDVSVELATGVPRTDGKKIYYRPPISLGDPQPHQKMLCEKRDPETLQQRCPACAIREEVLISIYHEIAHIAYGTFQEPSNKDITDAIDRAISEAKPRYADFVRRRIEQAPRVQTSNYLGLSGLISEYLPILVNSLEDARVDAAMFKARKGTKAMFDAFCQKTFTEGVEQSDGTIKYWKDYPLNSQALIGVFVLACEYHYEGWFAPEIEEALSDQRLRELTRRVDTLRSAAGTYQLAFPILERLRELGFCRLPEEEEPEQSEDGDSGDEPQPEPQDEPADDQPEPGESEGSGDGQSDDESSDDSDSSEAGNGSEDDVSDDASGGEGSSTEESSDGTEEEDESDDGGASDNADSDSTDGDSNPQESGVGSGDDSQGDSEPEQDSGEVDGEEGSRDGDSDQAPGSSDSSGEYDSEGSDGVSPEQGGKAGSDYRDDVAEDQSEGDTESERDSGDNASDVSEQVDDDVEAIDSGADEGMGGVTDESLYGTPEQVAGDVEVFSGHDFTPGVHPEESEVDEAAIDKAIIQGLYFEKPSANVTGVRVHHYREPIIEGGRSVSLAWRYNQEDWAGRDARRLGIDCDTEVSEQILGPALLETRKVFHDNAVAKFEHHLRSGRINTRVLGKRAWAGDPRLFQKKRLPGKKSYAVLIGIDISGSTVGVNIALAKRAAMAQAELCHRAGVEFAVYAHTAQGSWVSYSENLNLDIYEIKSFDDAWNGRAKEALAKIGSDAENLDGHSIEFYRKMIEKVDATDKIILYYSDGKMPAANHDEELEILRREIRYCKAHNITLMGVGIRTDSPSRHGLDTVQVDSDEDLVKVVRHLEKKLVAHG